MFSCQPSFQNYFFVDNIESILYPLPYLCEVHLFIDVDFEQMNFKNLNDYNVIIYSELHYRYTNKNYIVHISIGNMNLLV